MTSSKRRDHGTESGAVGQAMRSKRLRSLAKQVSFTRSGVDTPTNNKPNSAKSSDGGLSSARSSDLKSSNGRSDNSRTSTTRSGSINGSRDRRLDGGRFRWLNEQLYTLHSSAAAQQLSFEMLEQYHRGFRAQAASWPSTPQAQFADQLIKIARRFIDHEQSSTLDQWKQEMDQSKQAKQQDPSRKSIEQLIVADIGCGDAQIEAQIAGAFPQDMPVRVLNFDLFKANDRVVVADAANLPVKNAHVDIVIFCLSLMGTNYASFIAEAHRILKPSGQMWIAEVKSRFSDDDGAEFARAVVATGFKLLKRRTENTMFSLFYFQKTRGHTFDPEPLKNTLSPCLYKRR